MTSGPAVPVDEPVPVNEPAPAGEPAITAAATATTGASVLRGGIWSGVTTVLPQFYVLVQSVVAAHFLGVNGMGQQSFVSFVQVSAISLFTFGLNGSLVRYLAETLGRGRPDAGRALVGWVLRIELVTSAVAGGLIASGSLLSPGLRTVWLLAAAGCVLGTLNSIPYAVLAGTQRWRGLSIAALTTNTAGTLATIAVLYLGGGIEGMFAVTAVMSAVALLWTGSLARRALPTPSGTDARIGDLRKPLLRFAGVTWIGFVLSLIVWKRSEFFFLRRYSTNAQIAFYSIAFAAVISLTSAMEAIALVLAPAVATLSGAGAEERIRSGFARAARLLLLATLPLTAGAMAVGPATIALVYGSQYRGTTLPLLILLVVTPLLPLLSLSSALLWGLGRARVWLVVCASAAVVNIALDFLFIPAHGAVGAAIANTGAQVAAGAGIVTYACRQMAPVRWHIRSLLRAAIASGACGGVAWLVNSRVGGAIGLLAGVVTGFVTFVLVAVTLPILPVADAAWLEGMLGGRLGGLLGSICRLLSAGWPKRTKRQGRGSDAVPHPQPGPS